ncbi:tRNA dihydrouridine synthase DusB [archaeon]|jgi:tRNA-dihydrouridine synthase B|nr:tRNA dihydrouridine synthase DusB [archaeon]MBT4242067.1 tRNA dihydrouridine synthase DusB [archaeon]MBT4417755.1 tRNA dihydrouridine synthase DusB [archaeon]
MAKSLPKLKSKVVLAPMHDITNVAFRLMCKKYGAGLVSTGLLSANALSRGNKAVVKLVLMDKSERPIVGQIFGQNTENLVKAGKFLENEGFDIINLNFGCPSSKIIKQGCGSALLRRKNKIAEIVKAVSESVKKPVSVKIRIGIDRKVNGVEIAKICEENGADLIIVHARTLEQGYAGKADWSVIKEVKDAVKIPVIGNGDVVDGESCKQMFEETGCDYVMIGRAAIGNPFIFKQVNAFLKNGQIVEQTKEEKIADYFEYIELTRKFGIFSVVDAKMRAQEFTKGLEGSNKLRRKLNSVKSWEEIEKLMKEV